MTLREIFETSESFTDTNLWLYMPSSLNWTLDTEGHLIDPDAEELSDDGVPLDAKARNLVETLDPVTIRSIVEWADRLSGNSDPHARLDVFIYYYRFDAFPGKLGAPDPPPPDQILAALDREFYDSLGMEGSDTRCRFEDCNRGTIKFSAFCRIHHFEKLKKRPCPFSD